LIGGIANLKSNPNESPRILLKSGRKKKKDSRRFVQIRLIRDAHEQRFSNPFPTSCIHDPALPGGE
jgi:hypothetical protein